MPSKQVVEQATGMAEYGSNDFHMT